MTDTRHDPAPKAPGTYFAVFHGGEVIGAYALIGADLVEALDIAADGTLRWDTASSWNPPTGVPDFVRPAYALLRYLTSVPQPHAQDDAEAADPLREQFRQAIAEARRLQTTAEQLRDDATKTGVQNDEFAFRGRAEQLRWEALGLAIRILGG